MARVLGARRLSHDTDASTSNERQGEAITGWAKLKDHTVVALTDDTDVSGAVSPFDRDDLGPWLRPPRLHQWDVLVVAKLDRVSRSLVDFANLLTWCQEHGKVLVTVAKGLDFGTPAGQFIGKIVIFAEWERQTMRERRADAARKLYADAGFNGPIRQSPLGEDPPVAAGSNDLRDRSVSRLARKLPRASISGAFCRRIRPASQPARLG